MACSGRGASDADFWAGLQDSFLAVLVSCRILVALTELVFGWYGYCWYSKVEEFSKGMRLSCRFDLGPDPVTSNQRTVRVAQRLNFQLSGKS